MMPMEEVAPRSDVRQLDEKVEELVREAQAVRVVLADEARKAKQIAVERSPAERLDRTILELLREVEAARLDLRNMSRISAELERGSEYAGQKAVDAAREHLTEIQRARDEAARIVRSLRGTELSGQYAQDADQHKRVANRWRIVAVTILLIASFVSAFLAWRAKLPAETLTVTTLPMLALFLYSSIEAGNHRRREFDRRRIALRVAAMEGFAERRRKTGGEEGIRTADELLDDFIRKHMIEPDLDPNDMGYLSGGFGLRSRERNRRGASTTASVAAQPADAAGTAAPPTSA